MKNIGRLSSVVFLGLVMNLVPALAAADCTGGMQTTFGDCLTSASTVCASTVPQCSLNTDLGATSTADIITDAMTRCCRLNSVKRQKNCLNTKSTTTRRALVSLRSGVPDIKALLRHTLAEFRELRQEADPCSTASVS